jgi:MinD superfamily P-loop ATPase
MRITIASGKGGTGKTFVSTNLFKLLEESGKTSALIDCDTEVPDDFLFFDFQHKEESLVKVFMPSINEDKCSYCGACADICRYHAITCISSAKYIKVMDNICHGCHACEYVCKNGAIEPGWRNVGKVTVYKKDAQPILFEGKTGIKQNSPIPVIEAAIKKAVDNNFDYLIMDAPPGCSCPFVHTVLHADDVILVTEPTPFGLSDLKKTIEILQSLNIRFGVVINRSDLGSHELKEFLHKETIEILGEIPYSEKIAEKYASGHLVVEEFPNLKLIFEGILGKIKNHENSYC